MKWFDGDHYGEQLKEQRGRDAGANRCFRMRSVAPTLFMAIFLIIAGVLLFLGNIGWLPVHDIWKYWPLLMIGGGIAKWLNSYSLYGRTWGFLITALGVLYLGLMLGFFHIKTTGGSWPLSILFIVFGIAALAKTLDAESRAQRASNTAPAGRIGDADTLNDTALLGSLNRRFETANFRGGVLTALLGSVELDLRRAQISDPDKLVRIEVIAVLGSVKLRIPETWRLGLLGTPILGSYEDKTIPQARVDQATATLTITGSCILGSVEIEN
jgi:predicted membrane protein